MRLALLADIHANREALDACLAHAARLGVDQYVLLGDLVGYGADPLYVLERVARLHEQGARIILGNHDQAAATGDSRTMNDIARAAADWTFRQLDAAARQFLLGLPLTITEEDRLYVHASAADPSGWPYITSSAIAEHSMRTTAQRLTFCGHVHRPALYHMTASKPAMMFIPQANMSVPLVGTRQWLAVMGSVGQPRDGSPLSAWGLLDTQRRELTFVRTPWDIDRAAAKIRAAGLPDALAARLLTGR